MERIQKTDGLGNKPNGNIRMTQIKSKKRVRDHGEVFTNEREVKAMCDLIPGWTIDNTFLEPACGTGNFLVEIAERKFKLCKSEKDGLKALTSIVGIDIMPDNVEEARKRLLEMFIKFFPGANDICKLFAVAILKNNIICGDSLEIQKKWIEDGKM